MKTSSIGFIGGGRVTKILLQAFSNMNVQYGEVVVSDPDNDVAAKLKESFPFIQIADSEAAASRELVFISLHPPAIMDSLEILKGKFMSDASVVSLAPKITIANLSSKLGSVKNIARLIPNATSYINQGYNPVTFSPGFDSNDKNRLFDLLKLMGHTFEVAEEKLESYAIISAMLPTYFWFQWKYMEEIGVRTGLTEDESEEAVHKTLLAALDLMYTSEMSPEEVIDLIPVKPIGENENQIREIYSSKLLGLYEKIKPPQ